jgi:4-hydroxy-tetrahydrodipicolinate synthase
MLDRTSFRGIYVIVVTPFTDDFRLDEPGLARVMDFCLAAGVHGAVANAMASEGFSLGEAERKRAAEIVVGKAKGKVPVIVAVSAPHWRISIDFARHAEKIGADGIMSLPPPGATVADIKSHYRAIAEATQLPLVLQNAMGPGLTTMSAALLAELINELPTARFVKEESGHPAQTAGEIIRLAGDRLEGVMGGRAGKTFMEELRHGVSGTMPACEIADVHVALWNAVQSGDGKRARQIFQRLLPLLDLEGSYGMPLMKEVLKLRGVIGSTAVRQAGFRGLDDHARAEAIAIMDDLTEFMLPAYSHRKTK